jgi:hypothetical protein
LKFTCSRRRQPADYQPDREAHLPSQGHIPTGVHGADCRVMGRRGGGQAGEGWQVKQQRATGRRRKSTWAAAGQPPTCPSKSSRRKLCTNLRATSTRGASLSAWKHTPWRDRGGQMRPRAAGSPVAIGCPSPPPPPPPPPPLPPPQNNGPLGKQSTEQAPTHSP